MVSESSHDISKVFVKIESSIVPGRKVRVSGFYTSLYPVLSVDDRKHRSGVYVTQ